MAESLSEDEKECADWAPDRSLPGARAAQQIAHAPEVACVQGRGRGTFTDAVGVVPHSRPSRVESAATRLPSPDTWQGTRDPGVHARGHGSALPGGQRRKWHFGVTGLAGSGEPKWTREGELEAPLVSCRWGGDVHRSRGAGMF